MELLRPVAYFIDVGDQGFTAMWTSMCTAAALRPKINIVVFIAVGISHVRDFVPVPQTSTQTSDMRHKISTAVEIVYSESKTSIL
jgi:hypothetical protein